MSYSFNLRRKGFTEGAQALVKKAEKSPYLQYPFIQVIGNNVHAEFLSKTGKIIRMVIKPNGSYNLTSYADKCSGNSIRSDYDNEIKGMRDVLKSVEKIINEKKSKSDVLMSHDYTGNFSVIKKYVRNKGEKIWTAVKRIF